MLRAREIDYTEYNNMVAGNKTNVNLGASNNKIEIGPIERVDSVKPL